MFGNIQGSVKGLFGFTRERGIALRQLMFGLDFHIFLFELFLSFRLIKVDVVAFGIWHIELLSFGSVLGGRTEGVKLLVVWVLISIQGFLQSL